MTKKLILIDCPITLTLLCILGLILLWPYLIVSPENSAARFTPTPGPDQPAASAEFQPLSTRIWSEVQVYYEGNEGKYHIFDVIGGSDDCDFGRGVKVKYPTGSEEWKTREHLAQSGLYFVRGDDPALARAEWRVFEGCR